MRFERIEGHFQKLLYTEYGRRLWKIQTYLRETGSLRLPGIHVAGEPAGTAPGVHVPLAELVRRVVMPSEVVGVSRLENCPNPRP